MRHGGNNADDQPLYRVGTSAHPTKLREKAKSELGAKFSLPAFHDMVLSAGSVPLDVLGQLVDGWIAKEKAKA